MNHLGNHHIPTTHGCDVTAHATITMRRDAYESITRMVLPLRAELIAAGKLRPQDGFVSRQPSLSDRRAVLPIAGAPQWDDYAWFRFFEEFGELSDGGEA